MENFEIHLVSAESLDTEKDTLMLKKEIDDLGVGDVSIPSTNDDSEGGMGEPITIGVLTLAILPSLLVALVTFLKDWNLRHQNQSYTIRLKKGNTEIELKFPRDMGQTEIEEKVNYITQNFNNQNQ